jgi:signal transduction histidine kinase
VLLALVFIAMAACDPDGNPWERGFVLVLGVMQLAEVRLPILETTPGRVVWIILKLVFCFLLMGLSGALTSHYFFIILLPVVSAATYLGALGTLAFSVLAAFSYSSFFLFWKPQHLSEDDPYYIALNLLFILMAGQLVNLLAEATRQQSAKYKAAADQLTVANQQLREAEAAVRRGERLAALGQLSAGLAHELRNPLGTIKASAEMLAKVVGGENEVAREVTGFISTEVDRCNSLVSRFLDFARPLQLRRAPADLTAVLDRAIALAERDAKEQSIKIFRNYAPDVPQFAIDSELMERVFFNLLQNAVQASAPGGSITAKTRVAGSYAEIDIIDRGSGIEPKNMETIFNPFFTTKSNGVGLGLAIVSKIVDRHGGKMAVESQPGEGSVFRICLPLDAEADTPNQ